MGLLFTYGMTICGSVLSLISPFHGLLIYVCFALVKPEALWPWDVGAGNYSRIVAVSMLLGWSYTRNANFRLGQAFPIALLLVVYWIWTIIGAFKAPLQDHAWAFTEILTKIAIPVLVGITTIDSVGKLKALAWVIVGSIGFVAYEMNMYYLSGYNKLYFDGFAGLDNNGVACMFVSALGIAFFLAMHCEQLWQKAIATGLAGLIAHCVQFSFSRGGMLAMVLLAVAVFVVIKKTPKRLMGFALTVFLALHFTGPEVRDRFMSMFAGAEGARERSAQSRIDLWRDCWDVMKKKPVFGLGPDHWPLIAHKYGWIEGKEAHSLWVQTGAEQGFPGIGLLLSFYGVCMTSLWLLILRKDGVLDPAIIDTARMSLTSLVGFVVSAQFVTVEALEIPFFTVLLGMGALKLASQQEDQERQLGRTGIQPDEQMQITAVVSAQCDLQTA